MEEENQTQPCWHTWETNSFCQFINLFSSSCLTKLVQQCRSWQRSYVRGGKLLYSFLVNSANTHTKPPTHRIWRAIHLVLAKSLRGCTFWLLVDGKCATVWYFISYKNKTKRSINIQPTSKNRTQVVWMQWSRKMPLSKTKTTTPPHPCSIQNKDLQDALLFTQNQPAEYKKFSLGTQTPVSVMPNDLNPTSCIWGGLMGCCPLPLPGIWRKILNHFLSSAQNMKPRARVSKNQLNYSLVKCIFCWVQFIWTTAGFNTAITQSY